MDHFSIGEDDNISRRISMASFELPGSDIQRLGYLKKLKTNKKKYFVLRSTSSSGPSRLEYFDNEKKFRSGQLPKRVILLYKCFNINEKSDTKTGNVIALYLKEECFSVVAEDAADMQGWLSLLLEFQHEYRPEDEPYYSHYDYLWQVTVKPKGLGGHKVVQGPYRLCLSKTCINLVKGDRLELSIQLASIRRCGNNESFFFMEVGRSAPTGSGELWMQVDDKTIASKMHDVIVSAMKTSTVDGGSFRQRSGTGTSMVNRVRESDTDVQGDMRIRSGSEGRTQGSPRRRIDNRRPQTMYNQRPPSLMADVPSQASFSNSPVGSPHQYVNESVLTPTGGHRYRSDSAESRASHSSQMSCDLFSSSPGDNLLLQHRSMTPEVLQQSIQEESSYFQMSNVLRSTSPSPSREKIERPDSSCSEHENSRTEGYFEMRPGSSVGSSGTDSGYLDMAPTGALSSTPTSSGYLVMGPIRGSITAPIPIRTGKEPGGYMEMGPSSQPLPTVKEGGSGEAYLPMTPGTHSPNMVETENLRPAKVISYLSDDNMSGEFPKRSFSVGSRPPSKSKHRYTNVPEAPPEQKVSDNGRCSSAPHLIVQKMKGHQSPLYMNESSLSCSPMSQSIRSDTSETDSLMEMDFYRPRTASDSFGCRPRASSFNKVFNQQRQRSSSYGQQSKLAQLAHDVRKKLGSYESVRTLPKEQQNKTSFESIHKLNASSKASSSESMQNSAKNSGYVEMHLDKKSNNGYLDMTLGSNKGSNWKSSGNHSRSSSNQSLGTSPAVSGVVSPNRHEPLSPNPSISVIKASEHMVQRPIVGRGSTTKSPGGSGRESEDESYVTYDPENVTIEKENPKTSVSNLKKKDKGSVWSRKKDKESSKGSLSGIQILQNTVKDKDSDKDRGKVNSKEKGKSSGKEKEKGGDKDKRRLSESERGKVKEKEEDNEYMSYAPADSFVNSNTLESNVKSNKTSTDSEYLKYNAGNIMVSASIESDYVDCDVPHKTKVMSGKKQASLDLSVEKGGRRREQGSFKERSSPTDLHFVMGKGSGKVSNSAKTASLRRSNSKSSEKEKSIINKKSSESSRHDQQEESQNTHAYMEYDPANNSKEMMEEVKTPSKVKSFLSFTSITPDQVETNSGNPKISSSVENQKLKARDNVKSQDIVLPKYEGHEKGLSMDTTSENEFPTSKTKAEIMSHADLSKKKERENMKVEEMPTVVKLVSPIKVIDTVEEEHCGYVGLDYGDTTNRSSMKSLPSPLKVKGETNSRSAQIKKEELKNMWKSPLPDVQLPVTLKSKVEPSKVPQIVKLESNIPRKCSVSSLEEMKSEGFCSLNSKEKERSNESLDSKIALPCITAPELQKQLSMPCMALPVEESAPTQASGVHFSNDPGNRHSCSDLSSPYEQMNLPGVQSDKHLSQQQQQQSASPNGQIVLNYASLDLGSSEDVGNGDPKLKPKIRHPSSVSSDESSPSPFSYAQIDFKQSENLKNVSKESSQVKFSLE